jgi:hypothetical protein
MAGLLKEPSNEEVSKYIDKHENFHIEGRKQKENVKQVEELLESKGYSFRIKTKGREATLLVPPLWALNATLQLGHTIMTWDPDWVIYKNLFGSKIEVKYFGKDA